MKGFYVAGTNGPQPAAGLQASASKRSPQTIISIVTSAGQEEQTPIEFLPLNPGQANPDHKKIVKGFSNRKKVPGEKKTSLFERKYEEPERKNRVPKAAFRVTLFAILFFCAAMYSFFNLQLAFYFVLGMLFITFIFALVGFITSLNSGKDKASTTRGGRALGIISLLLSLVVFAAIAWFFINTPINL